MLAITYIVILFFSDITQTTQYNNLYVVFWKSQCGQFGNKKYTWFLTDGSKGKEVCLCDLELKYQCKI
jgi:hypothetical protein